MGDHTTAHISKIAKLDTILLKTECEYQQNPYRRFLGVVDLEDPDDIAGEAFDVIHDHGVPGCVIKRRGLTSSDYKELNESVKEDNQRRRRLFSYNTYNDYVGSKDREDAFNLSLSNELSFNIPVHNFINEYTGLRFMEDKHTMAHKIGRTLHQLDSIGDVEANSLMFLECLLDQEVLYISQNSELRNRLISSGRFGGNIVRRGICNFKQFTSRLEDSIASSKKDSICKQSLYWPDRWDDFMFAKDDMMVHPNVMSVFRHFIDHKVSCMLYDDNEFDGYTVGDEQLKDCSLNNLPTFVIWHLFAYRFTLPYFSYNELFEYSSQNEIMGGGLLVRLGGVNKRVSTVREQVSLLLYIASKFDVDTIKENAMRDDPVVFFSEVIAKSIPAPTTNERFLHGLRVYGTKRNQNAKKYSIIAASDVLHDIVRLKPGDEEVTPEYINYHVRVHYV